MPDPQAERIKALEAELESRKLVLLTDDWEQVRLKAQRCDAAEARNEALKEALGHGIHEAVMILNGPVAAKTISLAILKLAELKEVLHASKVAALAQAAPKSTKKGDTK